MNPRLVVLGSRLVKTSALWWFGVLVWGAVLWTLSANSTLPSGPSFPLKDKLLHCTYFCGGAFCLLLALHGKRSSLPSWRALVIPAFLFTAIIGALDEFHQTFTPGRSGNDPWDWLADVTGGVLAAWIVIRLLIKLRQTGPTEA
jgi:VanZ family protein